MGGCLKVFGIYLAVFVSRFLWSDKLLSCNIGFRCILISEEARHTAYLTERLFQICSLYSLFFFSLPIHLVLNLLHLILVHLLNHVAVAH